MTRFTYCFATTAVVTVLSGCGGGGSGGSADTTPAVQLVPAITSITKDISQGDELAIGVNGTWSGKNLGSSPVYLSIRDSAGGFVAESRLLQPSASLGTVSTSPALGAGKHEGTLELRACKDAQCNAVYAGGSTTIPYSLNVAAVADWETHQRDAGHRGYVPIILHPEKFALAWQWQRPNSSDPIGGINPVVTANNRVYVTTDVYFGEGVLYAFDEATGNTVWQHAFGQVPGFNPPAVGNGRVYAAVTGHEQTALWSFDSGNGNFLFKAGFSGQWPNLMAPTVSGDDVYTGAGYYGGDTYSFSARTQSLTWTHNAGGVWDMFTPAVDAATVYHYNGLALYAIDRASGKTTFSIDDPFGKNANFSYHGSPILGNRKNALALSGGANSGRAAASAEQSEQRVISSFNLESRKYEWSSDNAYLTTPAVANGVIYAARNSPMSLDAMDEATGKVLWSWAPSGAGDTSFHRNIVVTNNLLFVSTDRAVYAIDLASKSPVWSYPKPGMLAISAARTLYIATGATISDGGLVAIKLK
jgi:outer membrane protein assembly factor BamB